MAAEPVAQTPTGPPLPVALPLPQASGWRRMVVTRAQELLATLEERPSAKVSEAVDVVRVATQPHTIRSLSRWGGLSSFVRRITDRLGAGEARRSEDATAALLALRREVLLSSPPTVVAAHVPELREEVKRLVNPDEACYDIYLRLLDRIETGHPHLPAADPAPEPEIAATPIPTQSGTTGATIPSPRSGA